MACFITEQYSRNHIRPKKSPLLDHVCTKWKKNRSNKRDHITEHSASVIMYECSSEIRLLSFMCFIFGVDALGVSFCLPFFMVNYKILPIVLRE